MINKVSNVQFAQRRQQSAPNKSQTSFGKLEVNLTRSNYLKGWLIAPCTEEEKFLLSLTKNALRDGKFKFHEPLNEDFLMFEGSNNAVLSVVPCPRTLTLFEPSTSVRLCARIDPNDSPTIRNAFDSLFEGLFDLAKSKS